MHRYSIFIYRLIGYDYSIECANGKCDKLNMQFNESQSKPILVRTHVHRVLVRAENIQFGRRWWWWCRWRACECALVHEHDKFASD